ncbi:hypothetical protein CPC08DRAFT_730734 [Agrocybe pediades]|nr:hypothetical protein CPC08DRAFT_730734 [Agrocybe pediades]
MSSRVYNTSEEYLIAVRHCSKAVKEALATPGSDLDALMDRLDGFVSTIFETRQRGKLDPEVVKVNHLIHKFAGYYCEAQKTGEVGETFRQRMQDLVLTEYTPAIHLPTSRHVLNPARSAAPTAGPSLTSKSATPATTGAVKPAAKPTPINASAAVAKAVPNVPSAAPKPLPVASSSRIIATPNPAFFSNTTRPSRLAQSAAPADVNTLPAATSNLPAPTGRPTPPMRPTTAALKRLAEVSLPPIRHSPNQPATVDPRQLEGRQTDKGKGKEAPTGQKRKRDDEPHRKSERREYKGTNTFYQIPCDPCATAKRPCERKDGVKPRKGAIASCLACSKKNKACARKLHPVGADADLVVVDAEGNIVTPAANSRSKKKRAETDEDMEDEAEDDMPLAKKRQTKVKSAEFVEASDQENPMDIDPPASPQAPSKPPSSRAALEVRRVTWAAPVTEAGEQSDNRRTDPPTVSQTATVSASHTIPRPMTPLIAQPSERLAIPRITAANNEDPALSDTLWGSVPNSVTTARVPVRIPQEHFTQAPKLPANADIHALHAHQIRADEALFSLIPRQADIVKFLEEVQVERHEHMQLLAKQELETQVWRQSADERQSAVEMTMDDLKTRLAAIEPKAAKIEALDEQVGNLEEDICHDRQYRDAAFRRIEDLEDEVDRRIDAHKEACERIQSLEGLVQCHQESLEALCLEMKDVDPIMAQMVRLEVQMSQLLARPANVPQSPTPHPDSAAPSAAPTPYVHDHGSEDESVGRPHAGPMGDEDEDMVDGESQELSPQPSPHSLQGSSTTPQATDMSTPPAAASPQPTPPPDVVLPQPSLEAPVEAPLEVAVLPPTPLQTPTEQPDDEAANMSGNDSPPPAPPAPTLLVPPSSHRRGESISTRSRSTSVVTRSRAGSPPRRSPRLNPQVEEDEVMEGGLA